MGRGVPGVEAYSNLLPGISVGIARKRADHSMEMEDIAADQAAQRTDIARQTLELQRIRDANMEADRLSRNTREVLRASQIAENLAEEDRYKAALQSAIEGEMSALGDSSDPAAAEEAQLRAFKKTMHLLPAQQIGPAFTGELNRRAATERVDRNNVARMDELDKRLATQEDVARLKADAMAMGRGGRVVTEDDYVNRHLEGHAKRTGVSSQQADSQLRQIYREAHGGGVDSEAPIEADPLQEIIDQLERARSMGVEEAKVSPGGEVVPADGWFDGGDDIDSLIEEYQTRAGIKGGIPTGNTKAPAPAATQPQRRVFKFNPKTGDLE